CRDDPEGAAVLVVGGGEPAPPAPGEPEWPPRADVAGAATLALLEREIGVHTVAWAAEIAAGAPWRCYPLRDCRCEGTLPDTAAALLAVSALLRGDGALANVALERALGADPGHRLARSLRQALDGGWGPREIRSWLEGAR